MGRGPIVEHQSVYICLDPEMFHLHEVTWCRCHPPIPICMARLPPPFALDAAARAAKEAQEKEAEEKRRAALAAEVCGSTGLG